MDETRIPLIGILILNRNGLDWLPPFYDSLRGQDYPNKRLYLVDNASDDDSVPLTLQRYPEVTVIRMSQNIGFCMAYNIAMPYAFKDGCDWVIWANNDILLEQGCLAGLAEVAQRTSGIGVLGPAFLSWDSDEPNNYMVANHPQSITAMKQGLRKPVDVEWVEGSFLMVSKRCFESVGPLDPYLFLYWEETDFCRRARHLGWRVVLVPSSLARHYAGGWSQAEQQNKVAANYLKTRNHYIFRLANPFNPFARNVWDAFRLFLVMARQSLKSRPSMMAFQLGVLIKIVANARVIYAKWLRDRSGGHPPLLAADSAGATAEVIKANDVRSARTGRASIA